MYVDASPRPPLRRVLHTHIVPCSVAPRSGASACDTYLYCKTLLSFIIQFGQTTRWAANLTWIVWVKVHRPKPNDHCCPVDILPPGDFQLLEPTRWAEKLIRIPRTAVTTRTRSF